MLPELAEFWFWQRMVTPHMAGLAAALAKRGYAVTYVAEEQMSELRARQGWQSPRMDGVHLRIVSDVASVTRAVEEAASDSVHICQGVRGNGLVSMAQKALKRRNLRQWVVMETVSDHGLGGPLKRLLYRFLLARWRSHLQGVLTIGWRTADWVIARGMPAGRVFQFAYFLPQAAPIGREEPGTEYSFRFLFVGRFIELKRLDLLVEALGHLIDSEDGNFQLQVIGSGPLEARLRDHAERVLGDRLDWIGHLPMGHVREAMKSADCLVLPSRYDGWGAVVSEALMAGTPAIASDACGSAGAVIASQAGGVFASGHVEQLQELLRKALAAGRVTAERRQQVAEWGRCLGADAGADYLIEVVRHTAGSDALPAPPWLALT